MINNNVNVTSTTTTTTDNNNNNNKNFVGLTQVTDKTSISRKSNVDHSLRQSVNRQNIPFIYMNNYVTGQN